jgi:hypothetical protein
VNFQIISSSALHLACAFFVFVAAMQNPAVSGDDIFND